MKCRVGQCTIDHVQKKTFPMTQMQRVRIPPAARCGVIEQGTVPVLLRTCGHLLGKVKPLGSRL